MCYAVCAPLEGYLAYCCSIPVKLIEGEVDNTQHFWLQLADGQVIDPTADQFKTPDGKRMPKVYIGERPEWYKLND